MAEPIPAPAPQQADVPIIDGAGKLWTVPQSSVAEAVRQGGRVASPKEVQEIQFGGTPGAFKAAGLGALETATHGASTAAAAELGVALGKRAEVEQAIQGTERTNPIAHILGETAPLALVPEAAAEEAPIIAGERLASRAANFAAPKFVRGVAEAGHLQGSQGVSEDILNHDFAAQSYYAHAATPEALLGGVLNVGIGAGLAGAKRLVVGPEMAGRVLGAGGELAAADAKGAQQLISAGQRARMTSDEVSAAYAGIQDLAQQAARVEPKAQGLIDSVADRYAKIQSRGSREVESALRRSYTETVDRFAGADRVLDRSTREAVGHSNELLKGLGKMNELQFGLKPSTVEKLVDPTKLTQQVDAAIAFRRELGSTLENALPKMDVRPGEVKKILDVAKKLDQQVALSATADAATAAKASARLYTALDDTKRVVGRFAKFGNEVKDGSAQLSDDIYHRLLRPMLEDEGLWGENLARMQTETNRTFSEGITSARKMQGMIGQVLETPGGKPLYSTEFGKMRGVLDELEHASGPDDISGLKAEILQRVVDNTRGRVKAMVETMDLGPNEVAQLKKTAEAATRLEDVVKRAQSEQAEFRMLKELKAREMGGGSGGIVRNVAGVITSPSRTMQILGGLKRIEDTVRETIAKDAKSIMSGARLPVTVKPIGPTERRIATKAMQEVQQLAQDPRLLAPRVSAMAGEVGDVAPRVTSSLSATAVRFINHMATQVPPPLPAQFLDTEPRWSDSDAEDFYRKLSLGLHPLTTFERMQHNQLHEDERELMENAFGPLYDEMKAALLAEYKDAAVKGQLGKLSYQEKQAISMMIGVPLDATQTPEFTASMQQAAMSDPNAQGAIGAQAEGGGRPKTIKIDMSGLKTTAQKMGEQP